MITVLFFIPFWSIPIWFFDCLFNIYKLKTQSEDTVARCYCVNIQLIPETIRVSNVKNNIMDVKAESNTGIHLELNIAFHKLDQFHE